MYKLITPLVDFVTGATHQSKARVSLGQGLLGKLVDALVQWFQMTRENVSHPSYFWTFSLNEDGVVANNDDEDLQTPKGPCLAD
jgi:hypothetical protein